MGQGEHEAELLPENVPAGQVEAAERPDEGAKLPGGDWKQTVGMVEKKPVEQAWQALIPREKQKDKRNDAREKAGRRANQTGV